MSYLQFVNRLEFKDLEFFSSAGSLQIHSVADFFAQQCAPDGRAGGNLTRAGRRLLRW